MIEISQERKEKSLRSFLLCSSFPMLSVSHPVGFVGVSGVNT